MKNMKVVLAAWAALLVLVSPLDAATVDGTYKIVVPDRVQDSSVWWGLWTAADTLRKSVKESTGLDLQIVESSAATGRGFYLGDAFARREGLSADGLKGWGNAYRIRGGSVYFHGARDFAGLEDRRSIGWAHCVLPSVRAATRFMEDVLGVRFVMPGWVGTETRKLAAIELKEGTDSAETPSHDFGAGGRDPVQAIASHCFGAGVYHTYGGHLYPVACPMEKYAKEHPEYFGIIKGRRYCEWPWARNGFAPLCFTNPKVEQLIIDELCRRFDAGAEVCQLAPGDSAHYCECETCQNYGGLKENPGKNHSEQLWLFHRHIAERMLKERPGKIVNILSYGPTWRPPRDFRSFPSNVMVEVSDYSEENLMRWKEWGTVPHGFVAYIYLWGNYQREGFTVKHSLDHVADVSRRLGRYDIHGIYRCGYGELWGMEGPAYFVFNRLLRTPEAKVADLLSEYLDAAYGPAAKPMSVLHETLDRKIAALDAEGENVMDMDGEAGFMAKPKKINVEAIAFVWDEATVRTMERALAAARATEPLTDKQRRRLSLVGLELAYAKAVAEVSRTYLAFRDSPSERTAKPTVEAVRRHRMILDRIYGTGRYPKPIPGWPELAVFANNTRDMLNRNGRSAGRIEEPLSWDVEKILSDYDLSGWERKDGANAALRRLTEWRLSDGHTAERFECQDGQVHFVAAGEKPDVRIQCDYRKLVDLKPGTKCRLSWQLKMRDMKPLPTERYGGEGTVRVWFGAKYAENVGAPIVSYKLKSTDWVRQSVDFMLTGDPKTRTEVAFRILRRTGEFWIRNVTIEEFKE